jgi:signal transduction histidine kinase
VSSQRRRPPQIGEVLDRAREAVHRLAREAPPALLTVIAGRDPAVAWRSPGRRRAAAAAAILALALLAIAALSALQLHQFNGRTPPALELSLALGPLFLLPRFPLMAWRISFVGLVLLSLDPNLHVQAQAVSLVLIFCLAGLRQTSPVLWWMYAFMLVPSTLLMRGPARLILAVIGLGAMTVALDALASTRRARHALAEQVEQTELEEARRAVLQERARIAREMHDVVAHHMSMIAVQAETAPYRLEDLSEEAKAEFLSLSSAARMAMVDMRRLLGVLRNDEAAERAPQPQLADVPELIGATRRAGLSVQLSMNPMNNGEVPPSVGVCAFRIVQEALSNASRHAPGAPVAVKIDREDHSLRLDIWNVMTLGASEAANGQAANGDRPGHGLAGMRERVSLLGGHLYAGPAEEGCFLVSATLPLDGWNPGIHE